MKGKLDGVDHTLLKVADSLFSCFSNRTVIRHWLVLWRTCLYRAVSWSLSWGERESCRGCEAVSTEASWTSSDSVKIGWWWWQRVQNKAAMVRSSFHVWGSFSTLVFGVQVVPYLVAFVAPTLNSVTEKKRNVIFVPCVPMFLVIPHSQSYFTHFNLLLWVN